MIFIQQKVLLNTINELRVGNKSGWSNKFEIIDIWEEKLVAPNRWYKIKILR